MPPVPEVPDLLFFDWKQTPKEAGLLDRLKPTPGKNKTQANRLRHRRLLQTPCKLKGVTRNRIYGHILETLGLEIMPLLQGLQLGEIPTPPAIGSDLRECVDQGDIYAAMSRDAQKLALVFADLAAYLREQA